MHTLDEHLNKIAFGVQRGVSSRRAVCRVLCASLAVVSCYLENTYKGCVRHRLEHHSFDNLRRVRFARSSSAYAPDTLKTGPKHKHTTHLSICLRISHLFKFRRALKSKIPNQSRPKYSSLAGKHSEIFKHKFYVINTQPQFTLTQCICYFNLSEEPPKFEIYLLSVYVISSVKHKSHFQIVKSRVFECDLHSPLDDRATQTGFTATNSVYCVPALKVSAPLLQPTTISEISIQ